MMPRVYRRPYPHNERVWVKTGLFRKPLKHEWFLSGARPEVYWAPNDLPTEYHIMREYVLQPNEIAHNGRVYVLKDD